MIKSFKYLFIIFLALSFKSVSYSQNFFNEAVDLYNKEKYEDARFLF